MQQPSLWKPWRILLSQMMAPAPRFYLRPPLRVPVTTIHKVPILLNRHHLRRQPWISRSMTLTLEVYQKLRCRRRGRLRMTQSQTHHPFPHRLSICWPTPQLHLVLQFPRPHSTGHSWRVLGKVHSTSPAFVETSFLKALAHTGNWSLVERGRS